MSNFTPSSTQSDNYTPVRMALSLLAAVGIGFFLWQSIRYMANEEANKLLVTMVALGVGAIGIWLLYWVANDLLGILPYSLRERVRPLVFVGPALFLLVVFLLYPVVNTIYLSLTEDITGRVDEEVPAEFHDSDNIIESMIAAEDRVAFESYLFNNGDSELAKLTLLGNPDKEEADETFWAWVRPATVTDRDGESQEIIKTTTFGLQNYTFAFTDEDMQIAFRNNILWLIIGTGGSVALGLLIATFVDRIKREALAKTFVFLPLAISFVGASVIWRFVYAWQPPARPQIGIVNAMFLSTCGWLESTMPGVAGFLFENLPSLFKSGCSPVSWLTFNEPLPINTLALIVIMIWLQTGFCMVILSAALKGVPNDLIEAGRIDGANEFQIFFRIIIPVIRGSIITVTTTVFIAILKVFDIVFVMTSGKQDTEVIANRMFKEMFTFRNFGNASALAVILLVVVIPIMVINIRNLRKQGINQ